MFNVLEEINWRWCRHNTVPAVVNFQSHLQLWAFGDIETKQVVQS